MKPTILFLNIIIALVGVDLAAGAESHFREQRNSHPVAVGESPSTFQIPDYGTPIKYQTDLNCWDHASRGVVEWLLNRGQCDNPAWGGVRALNQDRSIMNPEISDQENARFRSQTSSSDGDLEKLYRPMHYAAQVEKQLPTGAAIEQDLLYATYKGQIFHPDTDTHPDSDSQTAFGRDLTPISASTLYPGESNLSAKDRQHGLWDVGGVTDREVSAIKKWMVTNSSPVLITFVPIDRDTQGRPQQRKLRDGRPFWHAAYVVGWNDKGFIVRDSSYGKAVYENGRWNRDTTLMTYEHFKDSGKAAAGYRLKGKVPQCKDLPATRNTIPNGPSSPFRGMNDIAGRSGDSVLAFQHDHDAPNLPPTTAGGFLANLPASRTPSIEPKKVFAGSRKSYWYRGQIWHYIPLQTGRSREQVVQGLKVPKWAVGYYLGPSKQLSFACARVEMHKAEK